jgi:TRAP-type C4-dicarboxylate transport system permease small subunit
MDWFEDKFNFIIDTIALVGGTFMIIFSIVIFILLIIDATPILDIFEYIILPGVIGFFGILILFALRITRHLTKK